jgi:hypothetical protein
MPISIGSARNLIQAARYSAQRASIQAGDLPHARDVLNGALSESGNGRPAFRKLLDGAAGDSGYLASVEHRRAHWVVVGT